MAISDLNCTTREHFEGVYGGGTAVYQGKKADQMCERFLSLQKKLRHKIPPGLLVRIGDTVRMVSRANDLVYWTDTRWVSLESSEDCINGSMDFRQGVDYAGHWAV
jgi:hypothetical protein